MGPTCEMLAAVQRWLSTDSWGPWVCRRLRTIEAYLIRRTTRGD